MDQLLNAYARDKSIITQEGSFPSVNFFNAYLNENASNTSRRRVMMFTEQITALRGMKRYTILSGLNIPKWIKDPTGETPNEVYQSNVNPAFPWSISHR